jgi:hypothetical protein
MMMTMKGERGALMATNSFAAAEATRQREVRTYDWPKITTWWQNRVRVTECPCQVAGISHRSLDRLRAAWDEELLDCLPWDYDFRWESNLWELFPEAWQEVESGADEESVREALIFFIHAELKRRRLPAPPPRAQYGYWAELLVYYPHELDLAIEVIESAHGRSAAEFYFVHSPCTSW